MAKYLTNRADDRLKRLVEKDNHPELKEGFSRSRARPGPPTIGRAESAIAKRSRGSFRLQKLTPDLMIDSNVSREAYAGCNFAEGDLASLQWHVGEDSKGFWLAMKCGESDETSTCAFCTGGIMPASVEVKYEVEWNDADLVAGFNWATNASGTHTIVMSGCIGKFVIEHGNAPNGHLTLFTAGTPIRSQLVLSSLLVSANAGWQLAHRFQYEEDGTWLDIPISSNFWYDSGSPTFDCAANNVLTGTPDVSPYWLKTGYDVQVNP